jgi:carboxypeptidase D
MNDGEEVMLTFCLLQGALMYDSVIGDFTYTQEEVVAVPYVQAHQDILNLNDTFLAQMAKLDQSCEYAALREKYLTFSASGY